MGISRLFVIVSNLVYEVPDSLRYVPGVTPIFLLNMRWKWSELAYPTASATCAMVRLVVANRSQARLIRASVT